MQHAIPFRTWVPGLPAVDQRRPAAAASAAAVSENAVVVFGRRGCCMCHVLRRLLLGHGVNPPVIEVDEDREAALLDELSKIAAGDSLVAGDSRREANHVNNHNNNSSIQFPVVFVGGKVLGGMERVMASHISGELVPILKAAGALWL